MSSMAIKYALKKRAKKMAKGGEAKSTYGNVPQELNRKTAEMLSDGKITKEQHDAMVSENSKSSEPKDNDVVSRIMKKRAYSEGGVVANEGEDDLNNIADGMPNEFDDLALDDNLHSDFQSDSEISDPQEDADREDIVARIMRSRAKKDRLPNPR